jgi:predicted nucleotidyltransferase
MLSKEVENKKAEIVALGHRYGARRLAVFGSAATGGFEPSRSDVDFLVEFGDMLPIEYANAYLGLLESLEYLLGRSVDLVTESSIDNPWFMQGIEQSRIQLYAA